MRNLKRFSAFVLAIVMVLSLFTTGFAAGYDVESVTSQSQHTYYVGLIMGKDNSAEAGSKTNPYAAIKDARDAAVRAGYTVYTIELVAAYDQPSKIEFGSESVGRTAIITASDGVDGTISYTGASTGVNVLNANDGLFVVSSGATVVFDGVTLKGSRALGGNSNGRLLYVANNGTAILNDVTVTGGLMHFGVSTNNDGSAIYVADGGNVTLMGNTQLTGNSAAGNGTVYVASEGNLTVEDNVVITNNTAANGAGLYVVGAKDDNIKGQTKIGGNVKITGNNVSGNGGGVYVSDRSNVTVSGAVVINANTKTSDPTPNNVYLAHNPTVENDGKDRTSLDLSGTTKGADIGVTADREYCYRLISLEKGYAINSDIAGNEAAWHDDCGNWDIRYMVYNGTPGLYLYYHSVDAVFEDVTTVTSIKGKDIAGNEVDFLKDYAKFEGKLEGSKLTIPGIVPIYGDAAGEDLVFDFKVNADLYRTPEKEWVDVDFTGKPDTFDFGFKSDVTEGTYSVTVTPGNLKSVTKAAKEVDYTITADRYFDLTVIMEGPLYTLETSVTKLTESVLTVVETDMADANTSIGYKITRDNVPVSGITVVLRDASNGESVDTQTTDAGGNVTFTGLDKNAANYYITLSYEETYKVISRDKITLVLSCLEDQTLDDVYLYGTNEDVVMEPTIDDEKMMVNGTVIITDVAQDGSVKFYITETSNKIYFEGNEGDSTTAPAKLSMKEKEMEASASTYGPLATAEMEGYTFLGWFTAPEGGELVEPGTTYNAGSARVLYAHWQKNSGVKYTVQHWVEYVEKGSNVGYTEGTQTTVVDGVTYYLYTETEQTDGTADTEIDFSGCDLKSMEIEGLTDVEKQWWKREGFTAKAADDGKGKVLANGSAKFSIFYDRNTYKINYFDDDENANVSLGEPTSVKFGAAVGTMLAPSRDGYKFGGWFDAPQSPRQLVNASSVYMKVGDTNVYASWVSKDTTNWAIKVLAQDIEKDENGVWHVVEDRYTELKTVYFDNDGNLLIGTSDEYLNQNVGSFKALDTTDPFNNLYGFHYIGYCLDGEFTSKVPSSDGTFVVFVKATETSSEKGGEYNADFDGGIVYLFYARNSGKVVVDPKDPAVDPDNPPVNPDPDIAFGGDYNGHLPPEPPGRDGYDFEGWLPEKDPDPKTEEDKHIDPTDPVDPEVDGDTTIYPDWHARLYNLTFIPGEGARFIPLEKVESSDVTTLGEGYVEGHKYRYDDEIGVLPGAEKPGYNFAGWYYQEDGNPGYVSNIDDANKQITVEDTLTINNLVISTAPDYTYENTRPLYAKYTAHVYTLQLHLRANGATLPGWSDKGYKQIDAVTYETEVTFDELVDLLEASRPGYDFTGWVLDIENASETHVENGKPWTRAYADESRTIHLYAVYMPIGYRYTFNLNDRREGNGSTVAELVDVNVDWVDIPFDGTYGGAFEIEAVRAGYTFDGWSLTKNGKRLTAEELNLTTGNGILYARWIPKTYKVTLILNGGTMNNFGSITGEGDTREFYVTFDEAPHTLPGKDVLTKEGYDFLGWLCEAAHLDVNGKIINKLPSPWTDWEDKDGITLRAQWDPYITFNPDGGEFTKGENPTEPRTDKTTDIDELPQVRRRGWTFRGWQEKDGNGNVIDDDVTLDDIKDATTPKNLYPKWVPNITFVSDGGTFDDTFKDVDDAVVDPETGDVTVPADKLEKLPGIKKPHWTFKGWVDAPKTEEKRDGVTLEELQGADEPTTVYPKFVANVTFDPNGGKFTEGEDPEDPRDIPSDEIPEELPEVERPGYLPDGWVDEKTGKPVDPDDLEDLDEPKTVIPKWEAAIMFDGNGGTHGGQASFIMMLKDLKGANGKFDASRLPKFMRNRYTFRNWYIIVPGENEKDILVDFNDLIEKNEPATVHAHWVANLKFDPNGGTIDGDPNPEVIPEDEFEKLPKPERPGYDFGGWADEDGDIINDPKDIPEGPQDMTAVWYARITFDANGGSVSGSSKLVKNVSQLSKDGKLPTATRSSYTFNGWFTAPSGGSKVDLATLVKNNVSVTVYAQWTYNAPDPGPSKPNPGPTNPPGPSGPSGPTTYTVTFDSNGGSSVKSQSVTSGNKATRPADPTRSGYFFDGWFTAKDGGDEFDFDTKITKSITLYAHWTKGANVDFDSNGGTSVPSQTVRPGDKASKPANPTRPDYKFDGWFTKDGKPWDFDSDVVTDDMTLVAKWTHIGVSKWLNTDDHLAYAIGYPNGNIGPLDNITRAEVAMIFYRLLRSDVRQAYRTTEHNFVDVPAGAWYEEAVATLANIGIVVGVGNNQFAPTAAITRAEFATICVRFDESEYTIDHIFPDVPEDAWYYETVHEAAAKGWVIGYPNGNFGPMDSITRAEAFTLVNRALGRGTHVDNKVGFPNDDMITWPDNMNPDAWYYNAVQETTNGHHYGRDDKGAEYWTEPRSGLMGDD